MIAKLAAEGIQKEEILHTAESLFHDHLPANKSGLASAWIYRRHAQKALAQPNHRGQPRYDFQFTSIAEMTRAHRGALRDNPVDAHIQIHPLISVSRSAHLSADRPCPAEKATFRIDALLSHSIGTGAPS